MLFFGVDNSSSTHTDNIKKDKLVLGEKQMHRLTNTTITTENKYTEAYYSIDFTKAKKNMYVCSYPTVPVKKCQSLTSFHENLQKVIEDLYSSTKRSEICIFCVI